MNRLWLRIVYATLIALPLPLALSLIEWLDADTALGLRALIGGS